MTKWRRGQRHLSWASNGNISVYIFMILFAVWLFFQVWAREGGGAPPAGLDPMVMAALGVAVTGKSVERQSKDEDVKERIHQLEKLAQQEHPPGTEKKQEDDARGAP